MTDQEKIIHYETIENLRQKIGGCFGDMDGIFAGFTTDEKRAKELCKEAYKNKISFYEVHEILLGYMFNKNYPYDHINQQLEKANKIFSKLSK
ncbi:MAG: hypothetical protein ACOYO1_18200 [Bacteroidales bacterium]